MAKHCYKSSKTNNNEVFDSQMSLKVFKFGGASVKDAAAIENLKKILELYPAQSLVVVISAMGKTTNFLENVVNCYRAKENTASLLDTLQRNHEQVAKQLVTDPSAIIDQIHQLIARLRQRLSEPPSGNYDFDYDQIVSYGELLSTTLISGFLNATGISNTWMDARLLVRTDATFREGHLNWGVTEQQIKEAMAPLLSNPGSIILTQGFIAGTAERLTTTLGREGSDYSAAIFAYALDAESVTIWKDVPGLLNADPKRFPDAVKLDCIPYEEAVELSYYGASIIHPKTLKPLQNKHIPLHVKSFFEPQATGSIIGDGEIRNTIPSYIVKDNQTLLTIFPRDFSFIAVDNLSEIFAVFSECRMRINVMQNSALSFSVCADVEPTRLQECLKKLNARYKVKYNENVQLVTIRHYDQEAIQRIIGQRTVLMRQTSRATIQFVLSNEKPEI